MILNLTEKGVGVEENVFFHIFFYTRDNVENISNTVTRKTTFYYI